MIRKNKFGRSNKNKCSDDAPKKKEVARTCPNAPRPSGGAPGTGSSSLGAIFHRLSKIRRWRRMTAATLATAAAATLKMTMTEGTYGGSDQRGTGSQNVGSKLSSPSKSEKTRREAKDPYDARDLGR